VLRSILSSNSTVGASEKAVAIDCVDSREVLDARFFFPRPGLDDFLSGTDAK
jgi:hypothetical protein